MVDRYRCNALFFLPSLSSLLDQDQDLVRLVNSIMVTKGISTFPSKLYNMLQAVTNEGSQVVMWLPRNDGFFILDEQAFINTIVPVYFNLTKMRSFTRQLNLWGFSR